MSEFVMPKAEMGDIVIWYPDGANTNNAHIALVLQVNQATLNINIFQPDRYNMTPKDGVRHTSDPRAKAAEMKENGSWDFTPRTKRTEALLAAMAQKLRLTEEPKK